MSARTSGGVDMGIFGGRRVLVFLLSRGKSDRTSGGIFSAKGLAMATVSHCGARQQKSQKQARRKKMLRAQDGILKYTLKMMEVCKAQGFIYGIISEKGKPIGGASDNLRGWWEERVRFDRNCPAATAKYEADHGVPSSNSELRSGASAPHTLQELQDTTLGSLLSALMLY